MPRQEYPRTFVRIGLIIDIQCTWSFSYHSWVDNRIEVQPFVREKEENVYFHIHWTTERLIEIVLPPLLPGEQSVTGYYTVYDNGKLVGERASVDFRVSKDLKKLEGIPSGLFNRYVWVLSAKS